MDVCFAKILLRKFQMKTRVKKKKMEDSREVRKRYKRWLEVNLKKAKNNFLARFQVKVIFPTHLLFRGAEMGWPRNGIPQA